VIARSFDTRPAIEESLLIEGNTLNAIRFKNQISIMFNFCAECSFIFFKLGFRVMVVNVTFNNVSVMSWRSDLLVEETRVSRGNHRLAANHCQTLSHNVVSSTYRLVGFEQR
jgi:hypothetical protein